MSQPPITIQRHLALGDILCSTVVADKLALQGHEVHFQSHPIAHPILRRCASVRGIGPCGGRPDINLDRAYEDDPEKTTRHFHEMFVGRANQQLAHRGISLGQPTNCRPSLRLTAEERQGAVKAFVEHQGPWVFVCPRSETYPMRQVTDSTWTQIAELVPGTKFWLGLHPAPKGFVDLRCRTIDLLILWLSAADLLITVDTGPMHIGAALGIPIVAIFQSSDPDLHLNDQNDYISVRASDLDCLNCQKTLCPINPVTPPCQRVDVQAIANWSNARLAGQGTESVSCVIPIYQPDVNVLNRCLTQVLPQVQEVIVTRARDGILPEGVLRHPKISHVQARGSGIGFGRNVNHGCRYTSGKYLLVLNDDAFLEPDCVRLMLNEMQPSVGMVTHLLRYPDGKIYHAGVWRNPGDRDWHHIDHLKWHPTFTEVTELENCCGTSFLVRRETHFKIGGFDEDFYMYSEDGDYAMRVRQHGWKIMYTPHARGTHIGHLSSNKVGDINEMIRKSNALFHKKWGDYLRHNINKVPGTFDYK